MPSPLSTRVRAVPVRPTDPSRRSRTIAGGVAVAAIGITQIYALGVGGLSATADYLAFVALPLALLGLLLLAARLDGRPLKEFGFALRGSLGQSVGFAALLLLVYLDLRLDPGFLFGFGRTPPLDPTSFGFLLFTAPLVAVAEIGLFFGYLFRTLSRSLGLRTSMLLAAGAFALGASNFTILPVLGTVAAVQYLFTTTVVDFVLGLAFALYCYKSEWSIVGPIALWTGIVATTALLPVGAAFPSWEVDFATSIVAGTALLFLAAVGLREPRLQSRRYLGEAIGPRRYRFRLKARDGGVAPGLLATGAVAGVALIAFAYGLPTVLGTSQPILAVATGSMAPTLERGTLVLVEHVAPQSIHVGTIIVFSVGCLPSPTVHRVIRIVSTGPDWVFQTKGDANAAQDPCTVPYSDVRGEVFTHAPDVGYLILDPLFAASVVALLIVVPWAWRVGRS